jgi:hypothetical protein
MTGRDMIEAAGAAFTLGTIFGYLFAQSLIGATCGHLASCSADAGRVTSITVPSPLEWPYPPITSSQEACVAISRNWLACSR